MEEVKNCNMLNKFLSQAIISDLIEGIRVGIQGNGEVSEEQLSPSKKHYIYGLVRLSKLLQCSAATAQRIKSSGILNDAILQPQNHRIMIMDADLALEQKKRIDGKSIQHKGNQSLKSVMRLSFCRLIVDIKYKDYEQE